MTNIITFPRPTTEAQCRQLHTELVSAANAASAEWLDPDSGISRYPGGLGSAWVKIANRGKFAKWMVSTERGVIFSGSAGVHLRAWSDFGFPNTGQSESHSVHVMRAVVRVLKDYGVSAELGSYNS